MRKHPITHVIRSRDIARDQMIVEFISAYVKKYGVQPPHALVCSRLDLKSKGNAAAIIRRLKQRGLLSQEGRAQDSSSISMMG